MQCEIAESYGGFDEDEQEFGEFVEDNSDYIVVDYDHTNPIHIEHPGYEGERPEHVEWLKKEKDRIFQVEFQSLCDEIKGYDSQIDQLKKLQAQAVVRRLELAQQKRDE